MLKKIIVTSMVWLTLLPVLHVRAAENETTDTFDALSQTTDTTQSASMPQTESEEVLLETTQTSDVSSAESTSSQATSSETQKIEQEVPKESVTARSVQTTTQVSNISKYITVTQAGYSLFETPEGKVVGTSADMKGKTYYATKQISQNNQTFYGVTDYQKNFLGYLSTSALTEASSSGGVYQSYGKYVTIKKNNYNLWSNFSWKYRNKTNTLLNKTYLAKGIYTHYNGSRYVSLYDANNQWQGYLNSDAAEVASGPQGVYQNYGKYVSIKKNNYKLWSNFSWKYRNKTNTLLNKTYLAKGIYTHYNGSRYVSLYDANNQWQGYLNSDAVVEAKSPGGVALSVNKTITVTKNNYTSWSNFTFSKGKSTKSMQNKPYLAKYQYNHFNGSSYYSLYDSQNQLQGYLNVSGLTQASGNNSTYVLLNAPFIDQNLAGAPMGCEAASLLEALQLKGYAKKYTLKSFINEMPIAKDKNPHHGFAGSPWVVLPNVYQSIFAKPLAEWGGKYSKNKVVNISGSSFNTLKSELKKGNPIVVYVTLDFAKGYWGNYFWGKGVDNAHIMTLDGFNSQKNQYHVSDPNRGKYWVSASKFEQSFNLTKGAVVVR